MNRQIALILTAKGVPFIYYGEEIGMHNITAQNSNEIVDIQGKIHYQLALDKGKILTNPFLKETNTTAINREVQCNGIRMRSRDFQPKNLG